MKRNGFFLLAALCLPGLVHAAYPDDLRLLTHNVYMLSTNLYPNWAQNQRAGMIAQASYMKGWDVVILNEAFDNTASVTLLNGLAAEYPNQTPVLGRSQSGWHATLGAYSALTPEDGGVSIVSRWPIEEKVQYVYSQGCGADALSNKGFVYVRIRKQGKAYHIVGTHAQSEDSSCSAGQASAIRLSQFSEMSDFLASKGIPASEAIFIGGDMNVQRDTTEYALMLNTLEASAPNQYAGAASTWDSRNNGIANYNYPNAAPEYLDYIFTAHGHVQPSHWHNQALDIPSARWEVTANGARFQYQDYSDHYPVAAFAYANASTPTTSYKPTANRYGDVAIEALATGKAIRTGGSATAWLTATGDSSQTASRFTLRNWYYPISFCVRTGDFIEIESRAYPGYLWNWWLGGGGGNYAYYPKSGDSSNQLRVENLSRGASECLQDGDTVAFRDKSTVSGTDYYLKRWPSGSWANHVYLWSSSIGTDEKFRIRVLSNPAYQSWAPYLRY